MEGNTESGGRSGGSYLQGESLMENTGFETTVSIFANHEQILLYVAKQVEPLREAFFTLCWTK